MGGGRSVGASDDRRASWNLHVCAVRCTASTIGGRIAIDAHLGPDEASSVILFTSQMLLVNPAATRTHASTHSNGPTHQRLSLSRLHSPDGAAQTGEKEEAPLSARHVFSEKRAKRSSGVLENLPEEQRG